MACLTTPAVICVSVAGVDVAALLADLASSPSLHGAACANVFTRTVFDAAAATRRHGRQVPPEHQAALAVSEACPVLAECRAWVEGLPPDERPGGVVGGMVSRWFARSLHASA